MFLNLLSPFNLTPYLSPESDAGGSTEADDNADLGTDEGDIDAMFDALDIPDPDEEDEEEIEGGEDDENADDNDDSSENEKEEGEKEEEKERTSKQSPEVDAAYARARKAEEAAQKEAEKAAQLQKEIEEHKAWQRQQFGHDDLTKYREEVEKQTKEQMQAKFNEQWNAHLNMAQQMRDAGYDERVITQYLEANKTALTMQQEVQELKQTMNKTLAEQERREKAWQEEQDRVKREQSAAEGRRILLEQHKALKGKYGELVPVAKSFDELMATLDTKIIGLISKNGLSMEDAFVLVNRDKLSQHEKSMTEKRTIANVVDRGKRNIETTKNNEPKPEEMLTKGQIRYAKEFGVPLKEVAKRTNPKLFNKNKGVS